MSLKYVIRDEKGLIKGVKYPQEMVRIVIEKYPNHSIAQCAEFSGFSRATVYKIARENGIEKSAEFKQKQITIFLKNGKNTRYKKGQTPPNKGKKQTEYMSAEAIERSKATRFKKGNLPHNHRPVGYERITRDGYIEVKTREIDVFELKHRLVWKQHHGAIPKGHNIQFKDGNPQNCTIENLYMIDRKNQMRENTIHNYPPDVKRAIRAVNKLEKIIKKIS
ncbi:MAG: HNH endonuclease [Lentimicrobiaceae bacterium]|nr:HNH endonuclease [Lentimicrobiaceae bacterium]